MAQWAKNRRASVSVPRLLTVSSQGTFRLVRAPVHRRKRSPGRRSLYYQFIGRFPQRPRPEPHLLPREIRGETDSGVSIQLEEIQVVSDIEVVKIPGDPSSGEWNFTDGVGTISPDLSDEIVAHLNRQRTGTILIPPRNFQIRFQGRKVCTLRCIVRI